MTDYDLKREIRKLGMTQKEFAQITGLSQNAVSQWVRGERPIPTWVKPFLDCYHKAKTLDSIMLEIEKLKE